MNERKVLLDTIQTCLGQKQVVFEQLKNLTQEQGEVLELEEINLELFEELIEKKELLLQQLLEVDDCITDSQNHYQHLLTSGLEPFQEQINLIRNQLAALGASVNELSTLENANKQKMDMYFNDKKTDIQAFRKSKNAASKYNQNMPDTHQDETSYFMDKKK